MKGKTTLGRVIAVALLIGASAPALAQRDWNDGSKVGREDARGRSERAPDTRSEDVREARGESRRDERNEAPPAREPERDRQVQREPAPARERPSWNDASREAREPSPQERGRGEAARAAQRDPAARQAYERAPEPRPQDRSPPNAFSHDVAPPRPPSRNAGSRDDRDDGGVRRVGDRGYDDGRGGGRYDARNAGADRGHDYGRDARHAPAEREARRLSDRDRQRLIVDQRSRADRYREGIGDRLEQDRRRSESLRQHRREQQYRYQQRYWERQRNFYVQWSGRRYDYDRDPFFYTAANYRYSRAGRWYEVNRYAADVLQQAIRLGYEEGYYAGEADRYDGWRGGYRDNYVYQDANLGYDGYYVSQAEYNWYFREGFRRGYDDGYGRAFRYGYRDGSRYSILPAVLGAILVLEAFD